MDTLRSVVHLQRELGDNLFNVLVSSDNTGAVRHFAEKLAQDTFPRKMIVGGCRYDILLTKPLTPHSVHNSPAIVHGEGGGWGMSARIPTNSLTRLTFCRKICLHADGELMI